jgi:hypothetical protein
LGHSAQACERTQVVPTCVTLVLLKNISFLQHSLQRKGGPRSSNGNCWTGRCPHFAVRDVQQFSAAEKTSDKRAVPFPPVGRQAMSRTYTHRTQDSYDGGRRQKLPVVFSEGLKVCTNRVQVRCETGHNFRLEEIYTNGPCCAQLSPSPLSTAPVFSSLRLQATSYIADPSSFRPSRGTSTSAASDGEMSVIQCN